MKKKKEYLGSKTKSLSKAVQKSIRLEVIKIIYFKIKQLFTKRQKLQLSLYSKTDNYIDLIKKKRKEKDKPPHFL